MKKYEKTGTGRKIAAVASIGALVNAGVVGCASSSNQQDWMSTDGASGRINMGDVQKALEESKDPTEFEKRVNEIYEGDFPILIRIEESGSQKLLSGFEDLNNSGAIEEDKDDLLFSANIGKEEYDLRGGGVNRHYSHRGGFGMGDMMLMYWIMSPGRGFGGRYMYYTSPGRSRMIVNDRNRYRSSSSYSRQRQSNRGYTSAARTSNPQAFSSSSSNVSRQRTSYQRVQSQRIRSSRSSGFKSRSSGSRGGLRGGS